MEPPRLSLPPAELMVIGSLDVPELVELVCLNESARDFVRYVDERVRKQGTIFQLGFVCAQLKIPHERWSNDVLAGVLRRAVGAGKA